jgi:hypothetical protein
MKHDRIERTTETKHKQKEQMQKVTALSLLVKNNNTKKEKETTLEFISTRFFCKSTKMRAN